VIACSLCEEPRGILNISVRKRKVAALIHRLRPAPHEPTITPPSTGPIAFADQSVSCSSDVRVRKLVFGNEVRNAGRTPAGKRVAYARPTAARDDRDWRGARTRRHEDRVALGRR